MPKSTDLLIYIYLVMCACMLLFDAFSVLWRKYARSADARQKNKWKRYFNFVCYLKCGDPYKDAVLNHYALLEIFPWCLRPVMKRKSDQELLLLLLQRIKHLIAFQSALTLYLEQPDNRLALVSWLQETKQVFVRLSGAYLRQDSAVRAFYAYLMRQCALGGRTMADPICAAMVLLVTDSSLYCRENALKALYAFGGVAPVVQALMRMSRCGLEHSSKLVTDGLLSFTGDKVALSDALWANWQALSPFYRTAVINYLRMADSRFCRALLPLLHGETDDREVRLAAVRYYRRCRYEPARAPLQNFVRASRSDSWEFAAVAALSLERYPGEDTEQVLVQALRHRNWYVRSNAAESLLALRSQAAAPARQPVLARAALGGQQGQDQVIRHAPDGARTIAPDDPVIRAVLEGSDRYARDILEYKLETFRKK